MSISHGFWPFRRCELVAKIAVEQQPCGVMRGSDDEVGARVTEI